MRKSFTPPAGAAVRRSLRALLLPIPLLLAGCGVVAAFVPPIDAGDALAVEGRSITTSFRDPNVVNLVPHATSTSHASVQRTFEDTALDLRGFSLARLRAGIGIDPTLIVTAPSDTTDFPERFTLTHVRATATVSDAVNGSATMTTERAVDLTFALDASSCTADSCAYVYAGGDDALADVLDITVGKADGDTLASFVDIVRLDGVSSTNTGTFTLQADADSDPSLERFTAEFTLRSGGTVIELGG